MIFVLEGPDGVGKSTLANEIVRQTKGSMIHCSYDKEWDMERYLTEAIISARVLSRYKPVVLDRWAVSDIVYGNAFRDGPSFKDAQKLIDKNNDVGDIIWIYCYNKEAVANHLDLAEKRDEMYPDISDVVLGYEQYVEDTADLNWVFYNYDVFKDLEQFVRGIKNG